MRNQSQISTYNKKLPYGSFFFSSTYQKYIEGMRRVPGGTRLGKERRESTQSSAIELLLELDEEILVDLVDPRVFLASGPSAALTGEK